MKSNSNEPDDSGRLTPGEQRMVASSDRDDFFASLRSGLAGGAIALAVVLPAMHYWNRAGQQSAPPPAARVEAPAAQSPLAAGPGTPQAPAAQTPPAVAPRPLRLASFGDRKPTGPVRLIANWSVATGDHQGKAFAVVDKEAARVWVFDPRGRLISATPALLGSAVGDLTAPGVGDKPLSQVLPEEKTTPAGRFIAEPGRNMSGEDIIWVDYDAAVSMHRVRATVKSERRLERLASPTSGDNRISFGCINLPKHFYEKVLSPTVHKYGAVIYVLPETRDVAEFFGAYDVAGVTHVAQRDSGRLRPTEGGALN